MSCLLLTFIFIVLKDLNIIKRIFFFFFSVTNYFLVNLSVADLLVTTVCMPMSMSQQVTVVWFYGGFMCKFSSYLQGK